MKMQKSAGPAPGRSAAEQPHVRQSGGKSLREPERYRYAVHPPIPKPEPLSVSDSGLIAASVSIGGMISAAPLWWHIDGLAVMGYTVLAAGVIFAGIRCAVCLPGMIRRLRQRRAEAPVRLVYATRRTRRQEERLKPCYVPNEVICAASKKYREVRR